MPSIRIALCFAALLAPITAWPQASNSTVRGSVADTQQAVIPSAKVLLTNTATGVARESVTNSAGLYVFPGVTPGPYRLKVELAGLQTFEGSLNVQVQQDATVDVIMQVASGQRGDERGCGGRNADGQCEFAIARVVTRTPAH